ncbi:uncharacterized protein [Aegilops tauschii subsp. strangulata]|uniref:uncharacterized protein n=1 Tax=Aegilops tauschii subsp. strangulata TaxID=200361 RepID=UPI003CC858EC
MGKIGNRWQDVDVVPSIADSWRYATIVTRGHDGFVLGSHKQEESLDQKESLLDANLEVANEYNKELSKDDFEWDSVDENVVTTVDWPKKDIHYAPAHLFWWIHACGFPRHYPLLHRKLASAAALFFHTGALRRRFPTGEISTDELEVNGSGGANITGWKSDVFPVESQDSMSAPSLELEKDEEAAVVGDGQRYEVCSEATSGWTRRVRLGKAPGERDMNHDRKTAVELFVRAYAEKCEGHVINPTIGTEFDSLDEAYEFYNLYSWETGFGILLAKSRLNVQRTRCMQEIVCACAGECGKSISGEFGEGGLTEKVLAS